MNKENLIKYHFWYLLGLAAAFTLIAWALLLVTVPSTIGGERAKIEEKWNKLKGYSDFKHQRWVDLKKKEADSLNSERAEIQKSLYEAQANQSTLMTWPSSLEAQFDFRNGKYALEVVVHPANTDPKTLTEDATHMVGILNATPGNSSENWFNITHTAKSEKGGEKTETVKFLRTTKIKLKDAAGKALDFGDLSDYKNENKRPVQITYTTGKYFGDDMTDDEIRAYKENYKSQLAEVLAELGPVNIFGKPVVLLRYGGDGSGTKFGGGTIGFKPMPFPDPKGGVVTPEEEVELLGDAWVYKKDRLPPPDNRFFPYVANWEAKELKTDRAEEIEEIWAAQENLWVQREMFRRIKAANDSLAIARAVGGKEKDGSATKWRNYYWEIDLKVVKDGIAVRLKNIRSKPQALDGLRFVLRVNNDPKVPVLIFPSPTLKDKGFEGDKVLPGESFPPSGKDMLHVNVSEDVQGIYGVEQVLTVETAAVKRIDVIAVAAGNNGEPAVSHRQVTRKLQAYNPERRKKATDDQKPADDNTGEKPKDRPKIGPGEVPGPGVGGVGMANASKHGLILDRYLEVSGESRKLPVNLVLVVDPEHVARVQAALIESPLRFLVTQVLWQRCQVALSSEVPVNDRPDPGIPPLPDREKTADVGAETTENVELTVYGVLTIYERPGRPETPK
jgi:hypothetical protein